MPTATKKSYNKKPDLKSRTGKFFINKMNGQTDADAQRNAGYPDIYHAHEIENSKTYQALQTTFKDELLKQISINDLSAELLKNIKQDTDKGAKNKSIEIALNKLEPDNNPQMPQMVNIVLKSPDTPKT